MKLSIRSRRPLAVIIALVLLATMAASTATSSAQIDNSIPFRTIPKIQGKGHISPDVGNLIRTDGVITAIAFNGFYMQDNDGDGSNKTSDGIFVSTRGSEVDLRSLKVLRKVRVTGVVQEIIGGGAATGNLSVTTITEPNVLQFRRQGRFVREFVFPEVLGGPNGREIPNEIVISLDELPVNLQEEPGSPFDPFADAIDFYESIEGMLVRASDPVVVGATRQFNGFSAEAFTVLDNGDNVAPADALTSRGGIELQPEPDNLGDQNPERVQIQFDGTIYPAEVPLLTVGDQLDDVWGVVGYSFGNFEINATREVKVTPGGLQAETTTLAAGDDYLTIASYNVLNLDPSDGGQFDIVAGHIVTNLASPDIVALQEIQDNNGTQDDDVVDADVTLQMLVDAIAAAGGPAYTWVDVPPPTPNAFGGQPGGNIRNAFLYNAERVSLNFFETHEAPDAFPVGSREALVGIFEFKGNEVILLNNHFSSRFGSTPIFGGPQPFVQAGEDARGAQSQEMNDIVDQILAENPDAMVAVLGDLNTFQWTNELADILPGPEPVLTNLVTSATDPSDVDSSYSFIFEGNSQMLDHFFVTDALRDAGAEFDVVHTNVDFPRPLGGVGVGSDHEPLVARFHLPRDGAFTLQVVHASDLEGAVEAVERAPNFAAIIDAIEDDIDSFDATITVSGGDNYIPGPFFSAGGDRATFRDGGLLNDVYNEHFGVTDYDGLREGGGRVDISVMNIIGFDATAAGNHDFDLGPDTMESIIEQDFRDPAGPSGDRWVGAQFPYLSSNLDFSASADLGNLFTSDLLPTSAFETGPAESAAGASSTPKIAPYAFKQVDGEIIGFVGATTPVLRAISSPGDVTLIGPTTNDMAALAAVVQPAIDAVLASGVDKVILLSHLQQIALEQELVPLLSGVDISLAAGSDTLLANADDALRTGDEAADQYPFITANLDGDPVALVSSGGQYSYVGRLVVDFDADGKLVGDDGLPLTSIDQLDLGLNGPIKTETADAEALWDGADPFAPGTKGELVGRLTGAIEEIIISKDGNLVGESSVFIEGRRSQVRTQETNFGNLSADANLAIAKLADPAVVISLKNGGGIRAEIGEIVTVGFDIEFLPPSENPLVPDDKDGDISQLDLENSLRFNNSLALVTATADELKETLEHAVAATGPGSTPGQFGQVGGLRFSYDPTAPAGSRVQSVAVLDDLGAIADVVVENGAVVGDAARTFRLVTLGFLAGGGDSYPFQDFDNPNIVDLAGNAAADLGAFDFAASGTEQDALAEFFNANHGIDAGTPFDSTDTPIEDDERIQDITVRTDTVLDLGPLDLQFVEVSSQRIAYRDSGGDGSPIVFVHGNSASSLTFRKQLTGDLGDDYRIVAIDLPGHGDSDPFADLGRYNIPGYAEVLADFADALDLEDAVFLGWSLGGHIVLEAHDELPDASGFLIYGTPPINLDTLATGFLPHPAAGIGFTADVDQAAAEQFATAFLAPGSSVDITPFVNDILRTDGNARSGLAASIVPGGFEDEIDIVAGLAIPLAIIHGVEEQLVSGEYIESLDIPTLWNGEVQFVEGAGHATHWEQPGSFDELVSSFVSEVS